jgi:hypothetical protein
VLNPLTVAEMAKWLSLDADVAIDAALVVGGIPLVAQSWQGHSRRAFLAEALCDPTPALIVRASAVPGADGDTVLVACPVRPSKKLAWTSFSAPASSWRLGGRLVRTGSLNRPP